MKKLYTTFILILYACFCLCQSLPPDEVDIGDTWYDVQTTRSMQNRVFCFEDNTIGATWNCGFMDYNYVGIGYNYYNGEAWDAFAQQTITSGPAKNPSYTKFMENGEVVVSEGANVLYFNYRLTKGEGDWEEVIISGPPGYSKLYSPQIVTTGLYNEVIHLLTLKKESGLQLPYQDNIGKILYSRSLDGGMTWDILHHEFDFNNDYFGFSELSIVWAEPVGSTLAFVAGDYLTDIILMKSIDDGDNWQKTIIWEHPYPFLELNVSVQDSIWSNTGAQSVVMDMESNVHLAFALCNIISNTQFDTVKFDKFADGIAYWREDMAPFYSSTESLHPDSLSLTGNLIGWTPYTGIEPFWWGCAWYCIPWYYSLGIATMPTLNVTDQGKVILVYATIVDGYNTGNIYSRHLLSRASLDGGNSWDEIYDLSSDLLHIFDECVFPIFAQNMDNYWNIIYQYDIEPGLSGDPYSIYNYNKIAHMHIWDGTLHPEFYASDSTINEGDSVIFNATNSAEIYYWVFEGGDPASFSGENPPPVVYFEEGIFDVELHCQKFYYSGSEIKEDFITVLPATKIKETDHLEMISIYPNPTKGKISLISNESKNYVLKIFDLYGNVILEKSNNLATEKQVIDLTGISDGIYILEISAEKSIYYYKKLVKKQ